MTDLSTPLVALPDGTLLPPGAPLLRGDDLGVLRGEGVFDTTLVVDGVPRDLPDHIERLGVSARMAGVDAPPKGSWQPGVDALIAAWSGGREMVLRLVVTRGPERGPAPVCYLTGGVLPAASRRQRAEGVRVLTLDRGFSAKAAADAPWLLAGAKTLSYGVNMAALRYAADHGADDVVFVGADGEVLEAPTSTVVIATGRTLLTPELTGILDGITVRRLLRVAAAAGWVTRRERLEVDDLAAADGVWLVSSARLLAPVTAIDGVERGDAGITSELADLLEMPR